MYALPPQLRPENLPNHVYQIYFMLRLLLFLKIVSSSWNQEDVLGDSLGARVVQLQADWQFLKDVIGAPCSKSWTFFRLAFLFQALWEYLWKLSKNDGGTGDVLLDLFLFYSFVGEKLLVVGAASEIRTRAALIPLEMEISGRFFNPPFIPRVWKFPNEML